MLLLFYVSLVCPSLELYFFIKEFYNLLLQSLFIGNELIMEFPLLILSGNGIIILL